MKKSKLNVKTLTENKISEIIKSEIFENKLNFLNENYSNQKQELLIRNIILEELNKYFIENNHENLKAFAELRFGKTRIDLSVVNSDNLDNPIRIELKYQFTNDFKKLLNYEEVIRKDFEDRKSDMFILIISNWKKEDKKVFDKKWKISPNLSQYITSDEIWKENIETTLNTFQKADLEVFDKILIDKPYPTEYYIYNLKRR
ncbi:hypothetical protein BTO06_04130 [Tenacibaculum sp. SZ-18]|uniref:hypothetical protein n=1 Tax=Tenacibaculum sp. SZ-18 TaxID=754423 RepID=UPI000C2D031D|nr:hypothetical protein [Tenacibaculum sp. SZ-18]AUC14381.1 hypothetical protein BTO06_04130 [Tenacibaculum sp. SZ-18]